MCSFACMIPVRPSSSSSRIERKHTPVPFIILVYVFVVVCVSPNIRWYAISGMEAHVFAFASYNICARINEILLIIHTNISWKKKWGKIGTERAKCAFAE